MTSAEHLFWKPRENLHRSQQRSRVLALENLFEEPYLIFRHRHFHYFHWIILSSQLHKTKVYRLQVLPRSFGVLLLIHCVFLHRGRDLMVLLPLMFPANEYLRLEETQLGQFPIPSVY